MHAGMERKFYGDGRGCNSHVLQAEARSEVKLDGDGNLSLRDKCHICPQAGLYNKVIG